MTLFRSEEHVQRWLDRSRSTRGAIVPLAQVWQLAKAWYTDPRNPSWTPRTRSESQAVLASVGLVGPFWQFV